MNKKTRNPLLDTDPDFILSPRHDNSLRKMMSENPDGVTDATICRALDISKEELQQIYDSAILKLRGAMNGLSDD